MPTDTAVDTVAHEACERERVNADPLRVRELCHRYIDYLIETRRILKRDRTGRETLREGGVGTEYLGLWFLADSVARRWKLDLPERPPQQLRWCECDPPDATFRGLLDWCDTAEKAIAGKQQPIRLDVPVEAPAPVTLVGLSALELQVKMNETYAELQRRLHVTSTPREPLSTTPAVVKAGPRQKPTGRKATDLKGDQRIADAWGSRKHFTHAELARALGMKVSDVKAALDRHA